MKDKLNQVDFHWFVVRSLPHQEKKLANVFLERQKEMKNLLEVYCPTHTTVRISHKGKDAATPLFAGIVFVLSTQEIVVDIMKRFYPEGAVLYDYRKGFRNKSAFLTIPEEQMRFFKDFNENYAEHVIILERPYSDYAFNPRTDEPNEIVKVIDGPLAGHKGYFVRFRGDKRLVFNVKTLEPDKYYTVSIPNIWNFHVVRLHNAEGDRQTVGTMKERAVDLLVGMLQACGYRENTLPMLYEMVDALAIKPSLAGLSQSFLRQGHETLGRRIHQLDTRDAELLLELIRYERDNPGYVKEHWKRLVIRPFLTPTSGVELEEGKDEAELPHSDFTELIRKVHIAEETYYPSQEKEATVMSAYYAHIGMIREKGMYTLFANWDTFLGEYFLTAGKANERLVKGSLRMGNEKKEKLIGSFRNFAPALYAILTDERSPVKAIRGFKVGGETLNVLAITGAEVEQAKDELINTCVKVCKEINTTTHLAVWRRYLRTVWLHR